MAHIKKVEDRSYPFIYNVDMAVGVFKQAYDFGTPDGPLVTQEEQPNKRDDVMLVQYLLKRVYQAGEMASPQLKGGKADPASLEVDGYCGPKTRSAIEHFQLEMMFNGRNIATDGCVDPERGLVSSITETGYTITWLNKYFWILYPALAPNLAIDYECPALLKEKVAAGGAASVI
jgi:hypothetical protein